ncbi:MAG: hypothetical protein HC888_15240 [Candidatus Competibacteraceae bacterium]|nr:hypothetical protein [Candidatus Competibacteraceae bacterium]
MLNPDLVLENDVLDAALAAYRANPQADPVLLLIDFRTLAYPILSRVSTWEVFNGTNPNIGLYNAYLLAWMERLTNIPPVLKEFIASRQPTESPEEAKVAVVVCDDMPLLHLDYHDPNKQIYWRHLVVPDYKGGRGPKPTGWSDLISAGYEACQRLGFPFVREPYMEADDLVAQFVRNRRSTGCSGVAIWTVDTDLLQLVTDDEPPVVWYNSGYPPYYRDTNTTKSYWLKRWKQEIDHPRDIARFKADNGDTSDNLEPGSPIGVIDLINPQQYPEQDHTYAAHTKPYTLASLDKSNDAYRRSILPTGLGLSIN